MLNSVGIQEQYRRGGDDLRVLIVGAGIAGITGAQLLRRAGGHPVLIERNPDDRYPGYMLALMPMVDRALQNSRSLATLMFHRSRSLAVLRELVMRFVSVTMALKPIQPLLATQPEPDAGARQQQR